MSNPKILSRWSKSRNNPGVYILIVLDEVHKPIYIGPLSEWQNLEIGVFEIRNFEPECHFMAIMSILAPFMDLNKCLDILYPLSL